MIFCSFSRIRILNTFRQFSHDLSNFCCIIIQNSNIKCSHCQFSPLLFGKTIFKLKLFLNSTISTLASYSLIVDAKIYIPKPVPIFSPSLLVLLEIPYSNISFGFLKLESNPYPLSLYKILNSFIPSSIIIVTSLSSRLLLSNDSIEFIIRLRKILSKSETKILFFIRILLSKFNFIRFCSRIGLIDFIISDIVFPISLLFLSFVYANMI